MSSNDAREDSFCLDRIFYTKIPKLKRLCIDKELRWVSPDTFSLQCLYELYQHFSVLYSQYACASLEGYVSFTRAKFSLWDKLSCDWCSLVNGVAEYILQALRSALDSASDDILLLQPLSNWILSVRYLRYLPYSVVRGLYDSAVVNESKSSLLALLNADCPSHGHHRKRMIARIIHEIVEFKVIVTYLEKRWCPFMHLKKMAYR